eukprot:GHVS01095886.1.p1 GENE.GHVS01095886.1~~GHVS01095886.1.p1  ORF type:complete len:499 (+),score=90.39 GHVS01095886.1:61-1557(+)
MDIMGSSFLGLFTYGRAPFSSSAFSRVSLFAVRSLLLFMLVVIFPVLTPPTTSTTNSLTSSLPHQLLADCWWDEGHMMVAAVAKLQLHEEEVQLIENELRLWNPDYPGLGELPTSAVWADHVKCTHHSSFCRGLNAFDSIEIFNQWHYIQIPYNPQKLELKPIYKLIPLPETGAAWAINTMFESLAPKSAREDEHVDSTSGFFSSRNSNFSKSSSLLPRSPFSAFFNANTNCPKIPPPSSLLSSSYEPVNLTPWGLSHGRPTRHQTTTGEAAGSNFSDNLQLRLLIHIFGDIHQPLHCLETFMTALPDGDKGGNEIPVNDKLDHRLVGVRNLHALWDSAGAMYRGSWPSLTPTRVMEQASKLVHLFPREMFGNRLKFPLDGSELGAVAEDTNRVAQLYPYEEITFSAFSPSVPYEPSVCHVERVRVVSQQQIVLAGYRLSHALKKIAQQLKRNKQTQNNHDKMATTLESSEKKPAAPLGWTWWNVACSMWPPCNQDEL